MNGFFDLLSSVRTNELLTVFPLDYDKLQKKLMSEMKSLDITVRILNGDETISLGSAEISVFRYRKSKNTNDISLVPHIKYGERAILLTADIDPTAQRKMAVEYGENVPLYFTSRQPLVMLTDGSRWQVQQWSADSIMLP